MNIPILYKLIVKLSCFYKLYSIGEANKRHSNHGNHLYSEYYITIKEYKFVKRLSVEKIHLIVDKGIEKLEETIKIMEILE